jgi:hypothetical protein
MAPKRTKSSSKNDIGHPTPVAYLPPEITGPEEQDSLAGASVLRRVYVASPTEPRPSVRVESVEGEFKGDRLWQVLLDVGNAVPVQRLGLAEREG